MKNHQKNLLFLKKVGNACVEFLWEFEYHILIYEYKKKFLCSFEGYLIWRKKKKFII